MLTRTKRIELDLHGLTGDVQRLGHLQPGPAGDQCTFDVVVLELVGQLAQCHHGSQRVRRVQGVAVDRQPVEPSGLAAVVSRGAWGVGVAGRAGDRGSASALAVR